MVETVRGDEAIAGAASHRASSEDLAAGDSRRRRRIASARAVLPDIRRFGLVFIVASLTFVAHAAAANPLSAISETFSEWKDRLFGSSKEVSIVDAPAEGAITLAPGKPVRVVIGKDTPERDFPKGKSRYRIVELPSDIEHAAVRVQIAALRREKGFGREVYKPFFYTLGDDDGVSNTIEVKPLHLDIRPFRRTRLLGCVTLEKAHRFALATQPDIVGKSYESEVRESVQAPTQGGFYYATDAVKVKLPWADSGELILEVTSEPKPGKGC